jgi:hypothetical protein
VNKQHSGNLFTIPYTEYTIFREDFPDVSVPLKPQYNMAGEQISNNITPVDEAAPEHTKCPFTANIRHCSAIRNISSNCLTF